MPKMKTHRGAAKRFEIKRTGKIVRRKAYGSHILTKKSAKRKRSFRQKQEVSEHDARDVRRMLRQG